MSWFRGGPFSWVLPGTIRGTYSHSHVALTQSVGCHGIYFHTPSTQATFPFSVLLRGCAMLFDAPRKLATTGVSHRLESFARRLCSRWGKGPALQLPEAGKGSAPLEPAKHLARSLHPNAAVQEGCKQKHGRGWSGVPRFLLSPGSP